MRSRNQKPSAGDSGRFSDKSGKKGEKTGRDDQKSNKKVLNHKPKSSTRRDDSNEERPRKTFRRDDSGNSRSDQPKRTFGRSSEGDRSSSFKGSSRRPSGRDNERGERRSTSSDRNDRGSRSFGEDRNERRPFNRDERSAERKPFNREDRSDRKPFNREDRSDRKPFSRDDRSEKRPFSRENNSERKPFNRDEKPGRRPFSREEGSDRRATGRTERTSSRFSGRDEQARPERRFPDTEKKDRYSRNNAEGEQKSEDTPRRSAALQRYKNNRADVSPKEAPNYNLKRPAPKGRPVKTERSEKSDKIRLNRYIANAGVCSRREADSLIEAGEIKVNGEVITEMGYLVEPKDTVQYGSKILNREKQVYVLLNKPKDFITTTEDPEGRKTVMDLVGKASKERLFPVGRLDRNTTGLLLFTNDGELAQKLTHPSNGVSKIYQVELDRPISPDDFDRLKEGVELEDGKAIVDDLAVLSVDKKFLGLEIHIGRNRIVRRIFEHLGYEVVNLDRVQFSGLTKKDLPRGNWRFLSEKEVIRLKYFNK